MKKTLATILALMMLLSVTALAETAAVIETVDMGTLEIAYEQNWVDLGDGLAICMPADWIQAELTDEMIAAGVFYCAQNPELTCAMGVAYAPTELVNNATLADILATEYLEVTIFQLNGMEFVTYVDPDDTYIGFGMLDGVGGLYTVTFSPIPDEDFAITAATIVSTLGYYTLDEVAQD